MDKERKYHLNRSLTSDTRSPVAVINTGKNLMTQLDTHYVNQLYDDQTSTSHDDYSGDDIHYASDHNRRSLPNNRRRSAGNEKEAWSVPDLRDVSDHRVSSPGYMLPEFQEVAFVNVPRSRPQSSKSLSRQHKDANRIEMEAMQHDSELVLRPGQLSRNSERKVDSENVIRPPEPTDRDKSNKICHGSPKNSSQRKENSTNVKATCQDRGDVYRISSAGSSRRDTNDRNVVDVEEGNKGSDSRHKRLRWLFYAIPGFLLFLLFLILMPVSFVYVDFDKMALLRSKFTGVVDVDFTYYPGCYVLGPDSQFLMFPRTGNLVHWKNLSVFSVSRLEINIDISFLYHIRSEELGEMYTTYASDYAAILNKITEAHLKNTAAQFTLDQYRLQRPLVEAALHNATREKLAPHFVDVDFFYLGEVIIPDIIRQRLMTSLIQQVEAETAVFNQDKVLTEIGTKRLTELEMNKKNELLEGSKSIGTMITRQSAARADHLVQTAEISAWDSMCMSLAIFREDLRMSLLYIHSLNKMDNLYWAPSEPQTNFSYTHFPGFDKTAYGYWKTSI